MDFGELFNTLLDLLVQVLLLVPKIVNWVLVVLIDLLLAIWPSSASLGVPKPSVMLAAAAAGMPFFPWSVVGQMLTIVSAVLGGVLLWKSVDLLWP